MKRKRSQDSDSTSSQIAPEDVPLPISEPSTPKPAKTPTLLPQGLPLTLQNLQQLPGSPPKQPPSNEAMSQYPAESANMANISHPTPEDVKTFLSLHGMWMRPPGHPQFFGKHPTLVTKVNQILSKPSVSDMAPESAEKMMEEFERLKGRSERKIFEDFWARIFRKTYPLQKRGETGKWDTEDWGVQGLDNNPDEIFTVDGCSNLQPQEGPLKRLHELILAIFSKVQRPKPDQTFGVRASAFSDKETNINDIIGRWSGVSKGIYHAFAIIEFKTKGLMLEAENQALRAGSTLVKVNRTMRWEAGMLNLNELGVDSTNFVFSFCMTPEMTKLNVHWATVEFEHGETITKYNMSMVKHYSMYGMEGLRALRKELGLILLWGTDARLEGPNGVRAMLGRFISDPSLLTNLTKREMSQKAETSSKQAASSKAESSNKPEASSNKGGVTTRSQAKSGS